MKRASLRERLQYWFDNTMSKGVAALIAWLAAASLIAIVLISALLFLFGDGGEESFGEQVWAFVMLTLEPDAVTFEHWTFRLATLAMVFTGIFLTSSLIGLLTTAIEDKFTELRKGRSRVLENSHTIILGWSEQVFPIISELAEANRNQKRASVVVLGQEDKIAMRQAVDDKVGDTGRMRLRLRSGDPLLTSDLSIASPASAKSIIILPPPGVHADAWVVKALLAFDNHPDMDDADPCIVAPIHDLDNLHAAQIAGRGKAELMLTGTLIARIAAQTCRQSGLSMVYSDLLDFAGDEIYFQHERALEGKTYGEALLAYRDSAVIGLHSPDGSVHLNPPMDTVLAPGEQVIAISQDDDTIRLPLEPQPSVQEEFIESRPKRRPRPERSIILGWNWKAPAILQELDHYVAPGSRVLVAAPQPSVAKQLAGLKFRTLKVKFTPIDTTSRAALEGLDLVKADHVVLLPNLPPAPDNDPDADTLMTLLQLRDLAEQRGYTYSIVSEMLDIRNRDLAEVAHPDDFILSDRMVSQLLAQVSENRKLAPVFRDLFDPEGSEIYLKPVELYVRPGAPVNFYTVVEAARRRGETAVGYRQVEAAYDASQSYGVRLNPDKAAQVLLGEGDKIIVLAEG